ncbi:hypothetical protein [Oryzibacter oryziterrae]|uniref:hypothetical protein n=1 Tax=Oryzibacter oryziterrae TaxID=2766474 RepID=UPI001F23517A|nr:hypothetical protein [Oryzibacter oryziterrae]
MTKRRDYSGIDCLWLGVDKNGHVAAFITAGAGPIPTAALDDVKFDPQRAEEEICSLPKHTQAETISDKGDNSSFLELAERGLFIYDWTDIYKAISKQAGKYELVARPFAPQNIETIRSYGFEFSDCFIPIKGTAGDDNLHF